MKLRDIHLRNPFVFAENGVYYLYGTRRGPATNAIPTNVPDFSGARKPTTALRSLSAWIRKRNKKERVVRKDYPYFAC